MQATAGGIKRQRNVFFVIRENYGKVLIREDGGKEG